MWPWVSSGRNRGVAEGREGQNGVVRPRALHVREARWLGTARGGGLGKSL
jgi:hypothetical protein